jgi:hypothetical protein
VTLAITGTTADPLAPIRATLRAMATRPDIPPLTGIDPSLTVTDAGGWTSATELVDGSAVPGLIAAAMGRWHASPHVAAALAWKHYCYWVSLPAVLGYAVARRVPLLHPETVVVRYGQREPFLTAGLTTVDTAVLPNDPLALAGGEGVRVVADEAALLTAMRESLVDSHFEPVVANLHHEVRLGHRTLFGSLASGIANGLSRASDVLPGSTVELATTVLSALGLADLVDLAPRPGGGLRVARRTCCLAFHLPEPRTCAGCVISRPPQHHTARAA